MNRVQMHPMSFIDLAGTKFLAAFGGLKCDQHVGSFSFFNVF